MNTFNTDTHSISSHQFNNRENSLASDDLVQLWLFRLMVPLGGYKLLLRENDFQDDILAKSIGFNEYFNGDNVIKYNILEVKNRLFKYWESAENNQASFEFKQDEVNSNINALSALIGLNDCERAMLLFTVTVHNNHLLENACGFLGNQNAKSIVRIFSVCLNLTEAEIAKALHPSGLLSSSGILSIDPSSNYDFYNKVELLKGLVDALTLNHDNPADIFRNIIRPAFTPKLSELDYPHIKKDTRIIKQYLQQTLISKSKGVNFLIYGIPGTGKTEFARMVSLAANASLFEVVSCGQGVECLNENDRFRAYSLGQILCARQSNACMFYDEVENILTGGEDKDGLKFNSKAWMNHVLENNPVPTFWVSNDISQIDPAFIRRFDYVLEIKSPPRSLREKLLGDYLEDLPVSQDWKKQMAENEALVPAIIERSANVARMSGMMQDQSSTESALQSILGNTIEAMGYRRPKQPSSNKLLNYRLDVLNTNHELGDLCDGLKQNNEARICLYGPSGTGKTAFGKYIAESLDVPLITKRASDIVSSFWGGTEENMVKMFEEAKQEGAVLMLDEADTFLSHRTNAKYNWEVSAVNEMLTQMESFDGLFIASTNYMDMIDSAAMRRFDVKLKFDYMKPDQTEIMFTELMQHYHLTPDPSELMQIRRLEYITPGDFAAVKRKLRLIKVTDTKTLFSMLKDECLFKRETAQHKIGFH